MLKKFLVKGAIALALVFALLFAVQLVDNALHKDDYAILDKSLDALNRINTEKPACSKELTAIRLEAFVNHSADSKISEIVANKKYLKSVYPSCEAVRDAITAVNVPDLAYAKKKRQFEELKQHYLDVYELETDALKILSACETYDGHCQDLFTKNNELFLKTRENIPELFYNARFRPKIHSVLGFIPSKIKLYITKFIFRII